MGRTGRQAVVPLPEHIDDGAAAAVCTALIAALAEGPSALVADMTATTLCDQAGADSLARAYRQAVAAGTELRLVIPEASVACAITASGLDRLVPVYPTLAAAQARPPPGPMLALAAKITAAVTTNSAAAADAHPLTPPGPAAAPGPAAMPGPDTTSGPADQADGIQPGFGPAVVSELVDGLLDGVALAYDDGMIVWANMRLAHEFGYQRGELPGRSVDVIVPADLREYSRDHQAACSSPPPGRPMPGRARRVGVRKNGSTFPADISLSPVATTAGSFWVIVVRDATEGQQLDQLAGLTTGAPATDQAQRQELLDRVATTVFGVALDLQTAIDLPAELARERIAAGIGHLDDIIGEVRDAAFASAAVAGASPTAADGANVMARGPAFAGEQPPASTGEQPPPGRHELAAAVSSRS